MLVGLLDKPGLFVDHVRRYTNSLTTQMIFGFRTTSLDDPKLKQLYSVRSRKARRSLANSSLGI